MVKKLLFFSLFVLQILVAPALADSYDYARIFDVAFKTMTQKDLYKALNESIIQQKNPLTQSQLVFLLKKILNTSRSLKTRRQSWPKPKVNHPRPTPPI
ncbi:hypothetical protein [Bdellovibrio bacteriovorus]|uniref:hypothetical protein n=1 Tax=Bdellovibrio bacteriovorus TaxID=959 RepID=UPI0035A675C3